MEVYRDMQQWTDSRRRVLTEGVSKRQILRETGMHWTTLEKILSQSSPPGYQLQKLRQKPKLGPYVDFIRDILILDKQMPKKQRHTAKRILERLKEKGYTGGYSVVKEVVAELKRTNREVFMPLVHRPGEAQVDYFHALVTIGVIIYSIPTLIIGFEQAKIAHEVGYWATRQRETLDALKPVMWSRLLPDGMMILGALVIFIDLLKKTFFAKKAA